MSKLSCGQSLSFAAHDNCIIARTSTHSPKGLEGRRMRRHSELADHRRLAVFPLHSLQIRRARLYRRSPVLLRVQRHAEYVIVHFLRRVKDSRKVPPVVAVVAVHDYLRARTVLAHFGSPCVQKRSKVRPVGGGYSSSPGLYIAKAGGAARSCSKAAAMATKKMLLTIVALMPTVYHIPISRVS